MSAHKLTSLTKRLKTAYLVLLTACSLTGAAVQAAPPSTDSLDQEEAQIHEQVNQLARMSQMMVQQVLQQSPQQTAAMWKSTSMAPADFPVPLYTGTGSTFLDCSFAQQLQSATGVKHMTVKTRDDGGSVAQWYLSTLANKGMKVGKSSQVTGSICVKGESSKLSCMIVISGFNGGASPETTVQISAVKGKGG